MLDRPLVKLYSIFIILALAAMLVACGGETDAPPAQPAETQPPPEIVVEGADEGEMCGGIAGIACKDYLWCDPEPGFCHGADIAGMCVQVPELCTEEYEAVCGCDGKTYSNDCVRRAAQVAKDHDGGCEEEAEELPS